MLHQPPSISISPSHLVEPPGLDLHPRSALVVIGPQQPLVLLPPLGRGGAGIVVVGLCERVLVADVRVLDPVQKHVHAPDPQHRVVEIVAVERVLVEPPTRLRVLIDRVPVVVIKELGRRHEEARGAARRVADHVRRRRGRHVHQRGTCRYVLLCIRFLSVIRQS